MEEAEKELKLLYVEADEELVQEIQQLRNLEPENHVPATPHIPAAAYANSNPTRR